MHIRVVEKKESRQRDPMVEEQKKPSFVGETAAVIAVVNFLLWAAGITPKGAAVAWAMFGAIFIADWMLGGIADQGLCKNCF